MKTTPGLLIALLAFCICVYSQRTSAQSADNYYRITDSLNAWYAAHPEMMEGEDGEYTQYLRWKEFWRNRVYGGAPDEMGSMKLFGKALKGYLDNAGYYSRSTIVNSDWVSLGPDVIENYNYKGMVTAFYVDTAIDRSMNTIFIGTQSSGIWKTTDGGQNWNNVTDGSGIPLLGIRDMTGDPGNGNIIYAGTGYSFMGRHYYVGGYGLIRSLDGGVTWDRLLEFDPSQDKTIYRVILDPGNPQRIYILLNNCLLRNNNAGIGGWDTLFSCEPAPNGERRNLRDLVFKPGDPSTLYIGADSHSPDYQSQNLAKAYMVKNVNSPDLNQVYWVCLDEQIAAVAGLANMHSQRFQVAVCPADTSAVYLGFQHIIIDTVITFFNEVWKKCSAHNWRKMISYNGDDQDVNWDKSELLVSPSDTSVIYLGAVNWDKYHHGNSITIHHGPDDNSHVDIRKSMIYKRTNNPGGDNDLIFEGNDGGLSKTINGGDTWENLNGRGLVTNLFLGIGTSERRPTKIFAGSMDNKMYVDSSGVWLNKPLGGDVGKPVVDFLCPDTVFFPGFGSTFGGTTVYVHDFKNNKPIGSFQANEQNVPNVPVRYNPVNHKSVYAGYHNIWKSVEYGRTNTFTHVLSPPTGSYESDGGIACFAISDKDTNRIYVAYENPIMNWWTYQPEKFFRTTNNENVWEDLTWRLDSLPKFYGITAIEIKPGSRDSLWIAFGGYFCDKDTGHERVMLSTDGGLTWTRNTGYSAGLPNLPVNCLRYMKGGAGRLFAGTDIGVFYKDLTPGSNMEWQPFNTGLPACIVTDLEVDNRTQKLIAGTYGRGVYETDLTCEYNVNPWVIHQNRIINQDTAVSCSIIIDSSFSLTVTKKLKLPPQAKIYVQPGGSLIVDGGTLTNKCSNMWQGIEVRGHTNLQQYRVNQGSAIFRNSALVENARIAVSTHSGIIGATDATFRNNFKAIEFLPYDKDQLSVFTKTTFETTRTFLDPNYARPQDFVSLWGVKGVRFLGCTFRNTTVGSDSLPKSIHGRGIYSIDASYTVDHYAVCSQPQVYPCPGYTSTPTTFKNLYYGIRVVNSNPVNYVRVANSRFEYNNRGFYLSGSNYSKITSNSFLLYNNQISKDDTIYGLYLGNCSGYQVEGNSFSSPDNILKPNPGASRRPRIIGLVVDNSGSSPNEIYRNTFDSLDCGIDAQRRNKSLTGDSTGLVLKCNTYANNSYDQIIMRKNPAGVEGIAAKQGAKTNPQSPGGNTFSPYHVTAYQNDSVEVDIQNRGENLRYFHHTPSGGINPPRVIPTYSTPEPSVVKTPSGYPFDSTTCCPSRLNNTGGSGLSELKEQIREEEDQIDSLTNVLCARVDGGSTSDMITDISFSVPENALQLQQELLTESPYLSDTIMKSAINKEEVLPNEMIRDILVANPQSAVADDVLEQLNNRFVPMPQNMLNEIQGGQGVLSPKDELEASLALRKQTRAYLLSELIRIYKDDTLQPEASHDSLISLLDKETSLESKYQAAFEYLNNDSISGMNGILDAIPPQYQLPGEEEDRFDDYTTYMTLLATLASESRTIFQLTHHEFDLITDLSQNAEEPICTFAKNILEVVTGNPYRELVLIPDDLKSAPQKVTIKTSPIDGDNLIRLFPNPAKQYVIVEYNYKNLVKSNNQTALLSVISTSGTLVESRVLNKPQDQIFVNTSTYGNGTFLFTIKLYGKIVSTCKLTVVN